MSRSELEVDQADPKGDLRRATAHDFLIVSAELSEIRLGSREFVGGG